MTGCQFSVRLLFAVMCSTFTSVGAAEQPTQGGAETEKLKLSEIPYKIIYETFRETEGKGSWELCIVDADGSNPKLLTKTPNVDELYAHASPDGSKVAFVADEVSGGKKSRNVYYMNIDGSDRVKVADNARQQCWSSNGKKIAYMKGEFDRYTTKDFASKGLFIYDLDSGKTTQHVNKDLHHLYGLCWSPDGKWFVATVHGGMGYRHALLAFELDGTKVFNLAGINGCRPDLSPSQKRVAWLRNDTEQGIADISFDGGKVAVTNVRTLTRCDKQHEIYHPDWSPDGKWIAVAHGPRGGEAVGLRAKGWNICVVEVRTGRRVPITTDGKDNKEPDWVPVTKGSKS